MYEVDFLPVESEAGPGSKSGDAIAVHWQEGNGDDRVVVIDSGFTNVGDDLADHIEKYFPSSYVDLVISTHPDADHINGIARLLQRLPVGELLVHQPRLHHSEAAKMHNIEAVDDVLAVARERGVIVTEPFTGLSRFDSRLLILGPSEAYYEGLLSEHIHEVKLGVALTRPTVTTRLTAFARSLLEYTLDRLPVETLSDDGETSPRNNSSVISLLQVDDRRLLFTGEAGIPALEAAADSYERSVGVFNAYPLRFFQAPHHGSKRNVGPSILNRILGPPSAPYGSPTTAFASSAAAAKKHPSPKVVNALLRRGCSFAATEGRAIWHFQDAPSRSDYSPLPQQLPLQEDTDDD